MVAILYAFTRSSSVDSLSLKRVVLLRLISGVYLTVARSFCGSQTNMTNLSVPTPQRSSNPLRS